MFSIILKQQKSNKYGYDDSQKLISKEMTEYIKIKNNEYVRKKIINNIDYKNKELYHKIIQTI